jgi:hypothetical protein
MGGGAEAIDAEPGNLARAFPRELERAIADHSGAEERCRFRIAIGLRQREGVARVRNCVLRIAAVEVVAGEAGMVAEILATL